MEGLKAICISCSEGKALAAALEAEGVHEHYAEKVPDHDRVRDILKNGGAIHVQADNAAKG